MHDIPTAHLDSQFPDVSSITHFPAILEHRPKTSLSQSSLHEEQKHSGLKPDFVRATDEVKRKRERATKVAKGPSRREAGSVPVIRIWLASPPHFRMDSYACALLVPNTFWESVLGQTKTPMRNLVFIHKTLFFEG